MQSACLCHWGLTGWVCLAGYQLAAACHKLLVGLATPPPLLPSLPGALHYICFPKVSYVMKLQPHCRQGRLQTGSVQVHHCHNTTLCSVIGPCNNVILLWCLHLSVCCSLPWGLHGTVCCSLLWCLHLTVCCSHCCDMGILQSCCRQHVTAQFSLAHPWWH